MRNTRWLVGVFILFVSPAALARLPSQFLTCTGYGEARGNPTPVAVSTVTTSRADLLNDERLTIDFYSIVAFHIDFRDQKFNGWFSVEDEGRLPTGSFALTKFSQLGKVQQTLVYTISDDASGHTFWRLIVKCKVSEK